MQAASHFGIHANMQFPFPNSIVNSFFETLLNYSFNNSIFRPEYLLWRIMDILPGLLNNPEFKSIKNYLFDNNKEKNISYFHNIDGLYDYRYLKLYQLSNLIADTFDQYLFYRPELIFSWEKNDFSSTPKSQYWQAVLWQQIWLDFIGVSFG